MRNFFTVILFAAFCGTANSWDIPCRLGVEILSCSDFCQKWKRYPPVKLNVATCVRGCKTAYDGMRIGYVRKMPSLDIKEPRCKTWWRKLHGLGPGSYVKDAATHGCKNVQIALKNCMIKQQQMYPEKFETEEPEEDEEDDDDDDDDSSGESGAATLLAHRSMEDQLSSFKKE